MGHQFVSPMYFLHGESPPQFQKSPHAWPCPFSVHVPWLEPIPGIAPGGGPPHPVPTPKLAHLSMAPGGGRGLFRGEPPPLGMGLPRPELVGSDPPRQSAGGGWAPRNGPPHFPLFGRTTPPKNPPPAPSRKGRPCGLGIRWCSRGRPPPVSPPFFFRGSHNRPQMNEAWSTQRANPDLVPKKTRTPWLAPTWRGPTSPPLTN